MLRSSGAFFIINRKGAEGAEGRKKRTENLVIVFFSS
jgi:hypothetical protein